MILADTGPYGRKALRYAEVGIRCIPLPLGAKTAPPVGYSGADHKIPSIERIERWASPDVWAHGGREAGRYETHRGNIAWVLPEGPEFDLLGVDVDPYAGKTGAKAQQAVEKMLGRRLTPTWRSSSKPDPKSGIRIYRVPAGLEWPGDLTALTGYGGIELIKPGHRYIVMPPSVHPSGAVYRWDRPFRDFFADKSEFPYAGDDFVELLTQGRPRRERVTPKRMSPAEKKSWLASLERVGATSAACAEVTARLHTATDRLAAAIDGGGIHDAALRGSMSLLRAGAEGHSGVSDALRVLQGRFLAARERSGRGTATAPDEWARLIPKGIPLAIAEAEEMGTRRDRCRCDALATFEARILQSGHSKSALAGIMRRAQERASYAG